METSPRKKGKHPSKPSQPKVKTPKPVPTKLWKAYSFFKSNMIVTSLFLVLLGAFVLKYYEDVHYTYSNFKSMDYNIYNVLEVSKDAKDAEIKAKYRELSLKWHPDKNKDCLECGEKFLKIKEAYKILMNPHLREMYDKTKGHTVDMIPSKTTTLNSGNFDKLVKNSNKVWVVQVYSDDNHRCRAFAPVWDDFATKYEKFAKFGRVNALLEEKVVNKLPNKPQVLPSIFLLFPNKHHDLVPTGVMNSVRSLGDYFVKNYPFYGTVLEDYSKFRVLEGTRLLLYSETKGIPLGLKYLTLKFHRVVRVYFVSNGEHYSKDELLIEDMKSVENMPKPPDKLELYNLLVALYTDGSLKYLSYQLKTNSQFLQQAMYSLVSMDVSFDLSPSSYDVLCSRHNIKDRVCVFVPDTHEMFNLPDVYSKYENFAAVLSNEAAENEQKVVTTVDLQFLKFNEKNKTLEQLYEHFAGKGKGPLTPEKRVFLVNKNKQEYAVMDLSKLTKEFVDELLTNNANVVWHPLPPKCKGDLYKKNCLTTGGPFFFGKLLPFF